MPCVDMPLEKLREYKGCTPCPEDFDKYWDDALREMNALDPKPEFIPHPFAAKNTEMYDLFFTGTKGARVHAKFVKPVGLTGKAPAILIFHGLSGSADEWSSLMKYTSEGFVAAFLDTRGQGGLSEDVGGTCGTTITTPFMRGIDGDKHGLLMRDCFLDTALMAKIVMELPYVDETRVGCLGGSQGGALSVACACLVPEIKRCAPQFPYLSDYKRVYNMDLNKGAYEGLRYYFRMFDPNHEREDEIFTKLGYIDIQNLAKRMKAELLMFTGLVDTTCPPSTQFAMYNKVTSKKNVVIYPEYGHEGLRGAADKTFEFMMGL